MTDTAIHDDINAFAISTGDKVRGEDDLAEGDGILGVSTASSGTPTGVENAVPDNGSGYAGPVTPDDASTNGGSDTTGYVRAFAPAESHRFGHPVPEPVVLTVSP